MAELSTLALAPLAGLLLGALFFGGLWWTVRRALASQQPALWLFPSLLLRTGLIVLGFYFVSGGRWQRLLLCLLGFVIARPLVTWLTRPSPAQQPADHPGSRHPSPDERPSPAAPETHHAP